MKRASKKRIIIGIFVIVLMDIFIGGLLFKSRAFSHLAIWNIIESSKQEDFYWQPEDAPRYFRFQPDSIRASIFKNEVYPLIKDENDHLKRTIKVAKYVMNICSNNNQFGLALKWDSPEGMLRQIKAGASANCFHRSVLFSTYLSSLGMKSRLWALENDKFNSIAHSVTEAYIENFKKWVFVDITFGFYVTENGFPLSFLELRERLLNNKTGNILFCSIDELSKQDSIPVFYPKLVQCVFLRANNNFIGKYDTRYGVFSIFGKYIDKFPNKIKIGVTYLFGGKNIFIHYLDRFSGSLKPDIIAAKLFFYFAAFSIIPAGVLLLVCYLVFRK